MLNLLLSCYWVGVGVDSAATTYSLLRALRDECTASAVVSKPVENGTVPYLDILRPSSSFEMLL